jgi:hypothetical protein
VDAHEHTKEATIGPTGYIHHHRVEEDIGRWALNKVIVLSFLFSYREMRRILRKGWGG